MMLPIPLLDRPSAVGDEGRPRATSLAVASFVAAVLVGVTGVVVDQPDLLVTLGTFTGLTAAGMALLDRERFVHLFFGHALLLWFGAPLALLVILGPAFGRIGLTVAGFGVALLGLAMTWGDAADDESLRDAVYASGRTYLAIYLWLFVFALIAVVGVLGVGSLELVTGTTGAAAAVLGFLTVLACTAGAVLAGVHWLPIRQLTPQRRRPAVTAALGRIRRGAVVTLLAAFGGAFLVVFLRDIGAFGDLRTTAPSLDAALASLNSWLIVGPLVATSVSLLLAVTVAGTVRWLAASNDPVSSGRVAAILAALPMALVALVGLVLLFAVPLFGAPLVFVSLVGPLFLVLCTIVGYTAIELELVPDGAGGPALAATGLVAAGIGASVGSTALTFVCVATALLVWDVSTFGQGVTAELGHRPVTKRLELVHGVLSVGVGVALLLVVLGLNWLRTAALVDVGGALPALVVCIGALLFLAPLRG